MLWKKVKETYKHSIMLLHFTTAPHWPNPRREMFLWRIYSILQVPLSCQLGGTHHVRGQVSQGPTQSSRPLADWLPVGLTNWSKSSKTGGLDFAFSSLAAYINDSRKPQSCWQERHIHTKDMTHNTHTIVWISHNLRAAMLVELYFSVHSGLHP